MAEHIHWKLEPEFASQYLGSQDLPEGKDIIVQVEDVKREQIMSKRGREEKLVMHFVGKVKPLILNKINCKNTEKALETPYEDMWVGKKLQLYVDPKVSTPDGIVSAVRIRDFAPEVPAEA